MVVLAAAGARVCAVEKDPDRLALLHHNLARLSLSAEVVEADILDYTPPYQSDFIILDAPYAGKPLLEHHLDHQPLALNILRPRLAT